MRQGLSLGKRHHYQKIVVAVDQDLRVRAWNELRQLCGRKIGEAQVQGSAQMPQFELGDATSVENHHAGCDSACKN